MFVHYKDYVFDLRQGFDISIPFKEGEQVNCYSAPPFKAEAFISGDFVGDIKQGGLLNYKNLSINPHGNGTHTECLAHISDTELTINVVMKQYHFIAQLITVLPEKQNSGDELITLHQLKDKIHSDTEALIVRTMPNHENKKIKNYNNTNPPYLHTEVASFISSSGIQHLLIDLPSIDREQDGGKLAAHKAFWSIQDKPRVHSTITELIYVPDQIEDGIYLLNLQIAPIESDASPSKPIIFRQQSPQ